MPAAKTAYKKEDKIFKEIENKFKVITKEPEQFLSAQPAKYDQVNDLIQKTYALTAKSDEANQGLAEVLQELIVEEMDEEQIWQQLELRNDVVLQQFLKQTSKLLAIREEKLEIRLNEDEQKSDDDEENDVAEQQSSSNMEGEDDDEELEKYDEENVDLFVAPTMKSKKQLRKSVVDDQFFKLGEMEEFLEQEDAKEMRKQKHKPAVEDDDGIDYFADDWSDDDDVEDDADDESEEGNLMYKDFFDDEDGNEDKVNIKNKINNKTSRKQAKDHFAENDESEDNDQDMDDQFDEEEEEEEVEEKGDNDFVTEAERFEAPAEDITKQRNNLNADPASDSSDDDDDAVEEQPKSSYEMRQERLQQRIHDYEKEILGEKPWQLKGEVQATNRPQNSLLEEILEFESTVRPAPIITEETTRCLEDIIRQRIKDQAWDDVQLKVRPEKTPQEYRKQLVLDQEKSKESLAQIYEKDYQREMAKLGTQGADTTEETESKEHKEIRQQMRTLFIKLDALSNFHFTPKPVAPELKIITNTPAVAMEEVAPVSVSDAKLLAPEEVYRGPKNGLLGKSERTRTDKNRERRKKKQKQRAIHKAQDEKDIQRQKMGLSLKKKDENARLLKKITKHRNVEKITASNDQGSLKSSKAFFSKLQDTTASAHVNAKASKRKPDAKAHTAKKFKS